jgi:hypothetical protein
MVLWSIYPSVNWATWAEDPTTGMHSNGPSAEALVVPLAVRQCKMPGGRPFDARQCRGVDAEVKARSALRHQMDPEFSRVYAGIGGVVRCFLCPKTTSEGDGNDHNKSSSSADEPGALQPRGDSGESRRKDCRARTRRCAVRDLPRGGRPLLPVLFLCAATVRNGGRATQAARSSGDHTVCRDPRPRRCGQ